MSRTFDTVGDEVRFHAAVKQLVEMLDPSPLLVGCPACVARERVECRILPGDPDLPRPYYHHQRRDAARHLAATLLEIVVGADL